MPLKGSDLSIEIYDNFLPCKRDNTMNSEEICLFQRKTFGLAPETSPTTAMHGTERKLIGITYILVLLI